VAFGDDDVDTCADNACVVVHDSLGEAVQRRCSRGDQQGLYALHNCWTSCGWCWCLGLWEE
jgi:hypothetical protein